MICRHRHKDLRCLLRSCRRGLLVTCRHRHLGCRRRWHGRSGYDGDGGLRRLCRRGVLVSCRHRHLGRRRRWHSGSGNDGDEGLHRLCRLGRRGWGVRRRWRQDCGGVRAAGRQQLRLWLGCVLGRQRVGLQRCPGGRLGTSVYLGGPGCCTGSRWGACTGPVAVL